MTTTAFMSAVGLSVIFLGALVHLAWLTMRTSKPR